MPRVLETLPSKKRRGLNKLLALHRPLKVLPRAGHRREFDEDKARKEVSHSRPKPHPRFPTKSIEQAGIPFLFFQVSANLTRI